MSYNMNLFPIRKFSQAVDHFKKHLKEPIKKDFKMNEYAWMIITEQNRYCITYKREYYKSFSSHFPKLGGGYGQVANIELLEVCILNMVNQFVMVMPDEKIYAVDPKVWLDYYKANNTAVKHLTGECALPLKMFRRFDE